jgi:hypothetical protein
MAATNELPALGNEETVMNYHGLVKSLDLPAGWVPPTELEYGDIRARAISRGFGQDQAVQRRIEYVYAQRRDA